MTSFILRVGVVGNMSGKDLLSRRLWSWSAALLAPYDSETRLRRQPSIKHYKNTGMYVEEVIVIVFSFSEKQLRNDSFTN